MTPEEAIKTIQVAVAEVEWDYPMNYAIAFETAIEALEKQMAKNPMGKYDENEHHIKDDGLYEPAIFGCCPVCNQEVQDGMIYCSFCGQALDWSDTE